MGTAKERDLVLSIKISEFYREVLREWALD
jgi:hypothetical protein